MLIFIKLIQLLNRQIDRVQVTLRNQTAISLQTVCTLLLVVGAIEIGGIEAAGAKSLNLTASNPIDLDLVTTGQVSLTSTPPAPKSIDRHRSTLRSHRSYDRQHVKLSQLVTDVLNGVNADPHILTTSQPATEIDLQGLDRPRKSPAAPTSQPQQRLIDKYLPTTPHRHRSSLRRQNYFPPASLTTDLTPATTPPRRANLRAQNYFPPAIITTDIRDRSIADAHNLQSPQLSAPQRLKRLAGKDSSQQDQIDIVQLNQHTFQLRTANNSIAKQPPSPHQTHNPVTIKPSPIATQIRTTDLRSLTMKNAIDIALSNNSELRIARLAIDKNQAGVRIAQAPQSVQVDLIGSLGKQGTPLITNTPLDGSSGDDSSNSSSVSSNGFNSSSSASVSNSFDCLANCSDSNSTRIGITLQAAYNLFNSGRDLANVQIAEAQVHVSRLDLQRIELQIEGNVVNAYYDLQAADLAVSTAENTVSEAMRSLNDARMPAAETPTVQPEPSTHKQAAPVTKKNQFSDLVVKFEALTTQQQLDAANQALTTAKAQQQTARKKIAQLLSVEDNTEFTAADAVKELGNWDYSLAESLGLAYQNRPELKQHLVNGKISSHQQIVNAANGKPLVNLVANYNLAKSISTAEPFQDGYSLGVQMNWSLWDGGAGRGRISQEQVNQETLKYQYQTTRNLVRFEVEQAYHNLVANKQNISTATAALKHAQEGVKIAPILLQANEIKLTDASQAQTVLIQARSNLVTAILAYNRSLLTLETATARKFNK